MKELTKVNNQQLTVTTHWITCFNQAAQDSFLLLAEKESGLTVQKCLDYPVIQKLEKEVSKKEILKSIRTAVLNTAMAFKYSEKMDISQATLLATDLYDAFNYDTIEDIFLMLKMARQGLLGSNKGRLDHDTMFNLFVPAYLDKKADEREKQKKQEKAELARNDQHEPMSEENRKRLDEIINSIDGKKEKKKKTAVLNHHDIFISKLPELCKNLSDKELKMEMQKALNYKLMDAYRIYKTELEQRTRKNKKA